MATDRRSDVLKWVDSALRKAAPSAWLLSLLFLIGSRLAAGLESTFLDVSKLAQQVGGKAHQKDQTSEWLVWLSKFVRESSPFLKAAGLVIGFAGIFLAAAEAAFKQIQQRAETWKEAPEGKEDGEA